MTVRISVTCKMGGNSEAPWRTVSLSTCCKVHLPQPSGTSQHHPPLDSSCSPFFPCLSSGPTSLLPASGPRDAEEFQSITLSPAMSRSHPSAAFSLARAKSHQCDPVSISGASQRVSPACSAFSPAPDSACKEHEVLVFFSISPFHSCPFFISPIPYSQTHGCSSASRNPMELFLLHPRTVQLGWGFSNFSPYTLSKKPLMVMHKEGLFDLY